MPPPTETPSAEGRGENRSFSRSFSLNKLFLPSSNKVSAQSVPATPLQDTKKKVEPKHHIRRSLSVPVNVTATGQDAIDDSRGLIRVIVTTPRACTPNNGIAAQEITTEESVEDILEEEAVCRICLVELGEGGETLKMECSCKGELALAHKDCAVKWFSIKGNKTCDVCRQEVRNLPVTLLKLNNSTQTLSRRHHRNPRIFRGDPNYRVWQDVPVLVIVSMLAYFCFLEQLLVPELGPRALALALPFSCVLGLVSSLVSSTMVNRSYIWVYATFQFVVMLVFSHIFYVMLHLNAILSVLLSSFSGFVIALTINSIVVEYLRWRTNQTRQLSQQTPPRIAVGDRRDNTRQEQNPTRQMTEP